MSYMNWFCCFYVFVIDMCLVFAEFEQQRKTARKLGGRLPPLRAEDPPAPRRASGGRGAAARAARAVRGGRRPVRRRGAERRQRIPARKREWVLTEIKRTYLSTFNGYTHASITR